eukprot:CAMPEP_0197709032 /NCGR_PEP_ID=MMETSP1338-20131121/128253_1 /TAXON_ID=43686 ORGANISM="Pelagodinium beii, Strain RCC1491" /NCGR_SAMPLE_ID=MMETSP1338 /ASSEMBLY_ACC=CAM_ASM_000754 /LENGTH=136 /DNA_ID=CAMNT_0043292965 /DNA_START=652 /DNA_END=1062 /DNA_ORIENTATION=+
MRDVHEFLEDVFGLEAIHQFESCAVLWQRIRRSYVDVIVGEELQDILTHLLPLNEQRSTAGNGCIERERKTLDFVSQATTTVTIFATPYQSSLHTRSISPAPTMKFPILGPSILFFFCGLALFLVARRRRELQPDG